jgi:SET domain-containing protein
MPKKIERRQSSIHGNGVFATEAIAKGERVVRYKGEVRSHADVDADYAGHDETGHTFLFSLNDEYVIDANRDGNVARWINHSCAPNCESEVDAGRVFIRALRHIAAGEELFYDYGLVIDEPHTPELLQQYPCWCGAKACRGTLLAPQKKAPRKQAAGTAKSKARANNKKAARV